MNIFFRSFLSAMLLAGVMSLDGNGQLNQTADLSPVLPGSQLPFRLSIEDANFSLPSGVHSYASGVYKGKWLILGGRTNGMHDFENNNNNFPPSFQNTTIYVVDPSSGVVYTKSLSDPSSGLSQAQIDTLSVTSPQSYYTKKTLYMTGGYGVVTESGEFTTKPVLTAIDLEGIIHWVEHPSAGETAAQHVRQLIDPLFQVTGGYMQPSNKHLTLLIFGQNFQGFYTPGVSGDYTKQIRRFKIHDDGKKLSVKDKGSLPPLQDPNYRRRDLNVVPVMHELYGTPLPAYIAYSGVFTPEGGVWTVPVLIDYWGNPLMNDASLPTTFKQAMNQYVCPTFGAFSAREKKMYVSFFGGISFGFFVGDNFLTDAEIPFINQVTTISLDKEGAYAQYLMPDQYPSINLLNPLLFGAGAQLFLTEGLDLYENGVVKLDKLQNDEVVGYIVGGIMSTLPNTSSPSDSAASPYIFRVTFKASGL